MLGRTAQVSITEQDYRDLRRCHRQNYEAFEIELAFDFVVANYIEIEKYIAEHLVLDMTFQLETADAHRSLQWGFIRKLSNWLASISFWRDLTRNRMISICGRGVELQHFKSEHTRLLDNEFAYAFVYHLRNYSQHGGFPITGSSSGAAWDEDRTQVSFSAKYTLDYELIRSYFEGNGPGSKGRKAFAKRIEAFSGGKPFDLKPIVRQSLGQFGQLIDETRKSMESHVLANENFVLEMISRFEAAYPQTSIVGLSAIPLNKRGVVDNRSDIIPVRDEFIMRARELRRRRNANTLANLDKRVIFNS